MKFYKNTILLRFKGSKGNQWANNRKIFNRLYNDYSIRNLKKENMKKNRFYSQSELYPFSPLINQSGYTTSFTPNTKINSPNSTRFSSYKKTNPISQNWDNNSEYNPLWRRNTLTEGNLYGNKIQINLKIIIILQIMTIIIMIILFQDIQMTLYIIVNLKNQIILIKIF